MKFSPKSLIIGNANNSCLNILPWNIFTGTTAKNFKDENKQIYTNHNYYLNNNSMPV
jgi:hypothetical protein